ncbi:MAG: Gfo/Idh/MocA family oxidoreductase, partial [Thermoguttaceae bacterium]|nr:Gfo/Idh/MocA family oxidoreductase [Thermoguttaceae bacterium]
MERRDFIKASGLGAAAVATGASALAQDAKAGAGKRYRVGLIGCGWYGKVDLFRLMQVAPVDVVSLCDVDRDALDDAAKRVAARQNGAVPEKFKDYREMLAKKDLDIVLVGTPDHWHALPMIAAVEAGADVYVQKPIGVDVVE